MSAVINLPEWATFKIDGEGKPVLNGQSLVADIHTEVAYPVLLREL